MEQPHVYEAVLRVLEHAKQNPPEDTKLAKKAAAAVAKAAMPTMPARTPDPEPEPEFVGSFPFEKPAGSTWSCKLPPIEMMQEQGFQSSLQALRGTWAWARDFGKDHVVWPTPTSSAQDAMRFDACGWPCSVTTPAQWMDMFSYWSVLREQMACGASRTQRNAVDNMFSDFAGRRAS